ncbi:DNA polymerase III, subunit gamma and tau [Candidatus Azambacteria bacterium RIFOXYD1_FULL_42_11]|uniref:DNA polymerase III subunit gamma/tau n=3 Tax=Candidatus Azamiibacteriota TaxID=1752741 RepID=A0A0G0ZD58_9BACT|nr:MAG: polymerase III subunit gamma and tau protein [Candidatus Azambacteria bacterium GW2011_GWA1_42_19]KKS75798.1 MAG: polymerase III subunit gamma and tau protein [Candidatus Azambacteria bacterium GW2011_GWA2_42_9]KKS88910.1 MAG: polymerase III subunit gamma and tau protein [Parcubacteria group bacterium GW2011_GWC1_43_11]OGD41759.1 MAG: DNA polymerase III, subunit gamma and tau [Candidatus Azambacteria bacterium RIFOXYD1_FULL_42_11]
MSNLVLYRKYRPQSWDEVIGQEHVVRTLTNAIKLGRVSHAYLFSGPRGTGKTTIARLLAKSLGCADLDLIEIDAASNRGIDEIRQLREGIKFSPMAGKYKVFIIDEVHQLTKEAFNALLKTLEEPPAHAIFVLATTEAHKVPETILSRVQHFNFKRLAVSDIIKKLERITTAEKIKIDPDAVRLVANFAGGSYRDAESMLEQLRVWNDKTIIKQDIEELLGAVDFEKVKIMTDHLSGVEAKQAIDYIGKLCEEGTDLQEFSKALINHLRKIMLIKVDASLANLMAQELTPDQMETVKKQAEAFSLDNAAKVIRIFMSAQQDIKRSPIPSLPIELAVVEVISSKGQIESNKQNV